MVPELPRSLRILARAKPSRRRIRVQLTLQVVRRVPVRALALQAD